MMHTCTLRPAWDPTQSECRLTHMSKSTGTVPESLHAPILVIGMHRSGTTLVTELLRDAGVFVGWRNNSHLESKFFLRLNDWILHGCGATWEEPSGTDVLEEHPAVRELITAQLIQALRAPISASYLGPSGWLKHRAGPWLPFPWAFKDPRTTFTLPLWLELFPASRIVHVKRHGIDVALSLQTRVREAIQRIPSSRRARLPALAVTRTSRLGKVPGGLAFAKLQAGLDLWDQYTRRAERHCASLGQQAMTVEYEQLLLDPEKTLAGLMDFCGQPEPANAARNLDASRAFAYRNRSTEELLALEEANRAVLKEFGY